MSATDDVLRSLEGARTDKLAAFNAKYDGRCGRNEYGVESFWHDFRPGASGCTLDDADVTRATAEAERLSPWFGAGAGPGAGLGAGALLVFILAVGYYITPALVGGSSGQLISNMIAMHMTETLNWSMAAALAAILLGAVLVLYWIYDRLVGIDNLKLG